MPLLHRRRTVRSRVIGTKLKMKRTVGLRRALPHVRPKTNTSTIGVGRKLGSAIINRGGARVGLKRRIGGGGAINRVGAMVHRVGVQRRIGEGGTVRLGIGGAINRGGRGLRRGRLRFRRPVDINYANRLAGPAGVNATGRPLELNKQLVWPKAINAAFAISIRPLRWSGMQARLGPWKQHVKLFNGTNGNSINTRQWVKEGKLGNLALKKGQSGCYDSHVRLWRHIVQHNIPITLCLEDDSNIRYIKEHEARMTQAIQEANKNAPKWEMLYFGRNEIGKNTNGASVSQSLCRARSCNGLFAYLLKLEGAKKLLSRCTPYNHPVDVYVMHLHNSGYLNALAMKNRLCSTVIVHSDTEGIV